MGHRHHLRTRRQVVELVPFQPQGILVVKQIRVVERRLVHELQGLRDEEHGKNDEVDLPPQLSQLFKVA
jgi:hypothetical protein